MGSWKNAFLLYYSIEMNIFMTPISAYGERSNRAYMKPKESDWKKFKNSLDKWRERYLKRKNDEMICKQDIEEFSEELQEFLKNIERI